MIHLGDLFDVLPTLAEASVDACVTDPPYGLGFMGKQWDTFSPDVAAKKQGLRQINKSEKYSRSVKRVINPNLKGRTVDGAISSSQIEYDRSLGGQRAFEAWTEQWAREVFRVLKPGAHVLVCGAPRSYHRMASGLEDAGFEIRDSISWNFGQGFPKSLNLGGGLGTALKPAWENITLARKPWPVSVERRTIVANLLLLEARLWSLLPANVAVENLGCSQSEYDAACAFAQWTADERLNTRDGLSVGMDTSRFVSAIRSSLSIVSSWNAILADGSELMSTFTTETRSNTTTDWRTLWYCSSVLTPLDIIQVVTSDAGARLDAESVVRYLHVELLILKLTRERSVLGPAISLAARHYQDADDFEFTTQLEAFVLCRKPCEGSTTANVLAHGTGALRIDDCRIEGLMNGTWCATQNQSIGYGGTEPVGYKTQRHDLGRWPSNVLLDEEAAAMLDEMSGESESVPGVRRNQNVGWKCSSKPTDIEVLYADVGGASRFFYVAKPSRAERDRGTHHLEPQPRDDSRKEGNPGGDNPRNRGLQRHGNSHPTVKPIELMRYLVRLVTPKGGTVLDPFAGSGTTGMACRYEGVNFIGIEREAEYVAIAERRIADCLPLFGEANA